MIKLFEILACVLIVASLLGCSPQPEYAVVVAWQGEEVHLWTYSIPEGAHLNPSKMDSVALMKMFTPDGATPYSFEFKREGASTGSVFGIVFMHWYQSEGDNFVQAMYTAVKDDGLKSPQIDVWINEYILGTSNLSDYKIEGQKFEITIQEGCNLSSQIDADDKNTYVVYFISITSNPNPLY